MMAVVTNVPSKVKRDIWFAEATAASWWLRTLSVPHPVYADPVLAYIRSKVWLRSVYSQKFPYL